MLVQTDARRHAFNRFERPPTAGATIELTIDEFLQHIAERELHAGVLENRARRRHGDRAWIRTRARFSRWQTSRRSIRTSTATATEFARRNRAVQDLYEPGSTFKVVTASAAIQEKLMPVDTLIDVSGGRINIGSRVVRDTHDYGVLSFTDVIVKSSNVGAIRIGFKLGTDRLSDYVQKFGFGRPVSPDFPVGEPGHRLGADEVDRQRARVGVHGLPGRRDAVADGDGGEFGRQRRQLHRAARAARCVPRRPPPGGPAEGASADASARTRRRR